MQDLSLAELSSGTPRLDFPIDSAFGTLVLIRLSQNRVDRPITLSPHATSRV